jgi:hypothetical protein
MADLAAGYIAGMDPNSTNAETTPQPHADSDGLIADGLIGMAWVLGIVAAGSVIRMLTYAGEGVPVHAELLVWVLVGTVAAVFSACCAVLAGIKSSERRLSARKASPQPATDQ